MNSTASTGAPRALLRSGLALADVVALPLLAFAFLVVLGTALASVAIAAGGLNFVLGLHYLDYFPTFPVTARLLCGLSLLAFSALMVAAAFLLWRMFRTAWAQYWTWHQSAWQGTDVTLRAVIGAPGSAKVTAGSIRYIKLSAFVFVVVFSLSFVVMMILAGGPFWHAWHWFT
jgi:hypothetical protein